MVIGITLTLRWRRRNYSASFPARARVLWTIKHLERRIRKTSDSAATAEEEDEEFRDESPHTHHVRKLHKSAIVVSIVELRAQGYIHWCVCVCVMRAAIRFDYRRDGGETARALFIYA